jgi:hypothetical protein
MKSPSDESEINDEARMTNERSISSSIDIRISFVILARPSSFAITLISN